MEMEYTSEPHPGVILTQGTYLGYTYYAVSYGTHPACYVVVPEWHRFYKMDEGDIPVWCHGGITFTGDKSNTLGYPSAWCIGWDYAHCDDYIGFYILTPEFSPLWGKHKWTTEELVQECFGVIKQLKAAEAEQFDK